MAKTILNSKQAAQFIGVSGNALRTMCARRKIAYYKNRTGGRVFFLQNELEEWMLATRVPTDEEVTERAIKELSKV